MWLVHHYNHEDDNDDDDENSPGGVSKEGGPPQDDDDEAGNNKDEAEHKPHSDSEGGQPSGKEAEGKEKDSVVCTTGDCPGSERAWSGKMGESKTHPNLVSCTESFDDGSSYESNDCDVSEELVRMHGDTKPTAGRDMSNRDILLYFLSDDTDKAQCDDESSFDDGLHDNGSNFTEYHGLVREFE